MDPPADPTTAAPPTADLPAGRPAAPATPPTVPSGAATEPSNAPPPDVDPTTTFEIPKKDGSGIVTATLQQMADALLAGEVTKQPEGKEPEYDQKFAAFQKAVGGNDRQAMHDLLDMYVPAAAEPKPGAAPADSRVDALEKELATLKQAVGAQSPIVRQIEDARIQTGVANLIQQHVANLPYLAKSPGDSARMVTQKIHEYRDAAVQNLGLTEDQFDNHPRRQQVLAKAMMECEAQMRVIAERYRGFEPTQPATNAAPAAAAVDDQKASPPGMVKARFQMVNGQLVDSQGQAVAQAKHGEMQTVPNVPLGTEPGGTAVGPTSAPTQAGQYGVDSMKARMAKRLQEISAE